MAQKPSYEELEQRISDLESELLKYKGGISEDFKSVADQMLVGVYQYDLLSRKFTLLNKRCYEFFKFEEGGKEVVTTKSVLLHIHPRYRDKVRNASAESLAPGSDGGEVEYCLLREDGSERWMQDIWIVIRDNSGRPVAIQGMVRDDTERKKADEALRVSEERYRTILESIDEGYYEVDLKGNFTFVNDSMCKIRGASMDELIGMNNQEYMDQKTAKRLYRNFNEVYRTGKPVKRIEWESIRKDGIKRHVESSASLMKDANGNPVGFRGITADITERKQAEDALRESEEKNRILIETMNEGLLVQDKNDAITYINNKMAEMLGYSKDEVTGRKATDFHEDSDLRSVKKHRGKREKRSQKSHEMTWKGKNGRRIYTIVSPQPFFDKKNRPKGGFAVITNITKLKQTEQKLRKRENELEIKTDNLNEMNTALKVLLKTRDEDKIELEERVLYNVKELIEPYLKKFKSSGLKDRQKVLFEILESNLKDIISPFSRRMTSTFLRLTPKELQIANLIKQGKTSKDIGDLMGISSRTVETHRKNLRDKIGIGNKKANLRTHLLSIH